MQILQQEYQLWRVVPPSTQHFYFSVRFIKSPLAQFKKLPRSSVGFALDGSVENLDATTFTIDDYGTDSWGDVILFHGNNVSPPATEAIDTHVTVFNRVQVPEYHGPTRFRHVTIRSGPASLTSHLRGSPFQHTVEPASRVIKTHWSLTYSVFSARPKECDSRAFFDEPRTLELACSTDLHLMKVPYALGETESLSAALEAHLHKNYTWYCALYRQVCTMFTFTPSYMQLHPPKCAKMLQAASVEFMEGPTPCIELDAFTDFFGFCGLLDDRLTLAATRQIFLASNVEIEDAENLDLSLINSLNHDVDMCRYEFIEALLRAALIKYPNDEPLAAVTHFLEDLREGCKYGSKWVHLPNDVRTLIYTEPVDRVLRSHLPGLRRLFAKHVHIEATTASPRLGGTDIVGYKMNFRQFFNLLDDETFLFPRMLAPQAARQIFNEAKMEAIIGVASAKTSRLSFSDFLDALCRLAHYLIPFQPLQHVVLLMLDRTFFKDRLPTDCDHRYFGEEERQLIKWVSKRVVLAGDHHFYARKEERLDSIYQVRKLHLCMS